MDPKPNPDETDEPEDTPTPPASSQPLIDPDEFQRRSLLHDSGWLTDDEEEYQDWRRTVNPYS